MRIVAWDLETSSLDADWGRILCASFCPITTENIVNKVTTISKPVRPKDPLDDASLCVAIVQELEKYNLIVTWNGKLFDAAFLNARLLKHGLPDWDPQLHLDAMWYAAGNSARLASRKLDNVAKFFRTKNQKYDVMPEVMQSARFGDISALKEIIVHCEADVRILSEVYWKLLPRIRNIHR